MPSCMVVTFASAGVASSLPGGRSSVWRLRGHSLRIRPYGFSMKRQVHSIAVRRRTFRQRSMRYRGDAPPSSLRTGSLSVVDADEIIVLEAGKVAERGSHAALLARGGLYAAMWARQIGRAHV